jgi:formylglycine-generating enzyme required for sulfatase activity
MTAPADFLSRRGYRLPIEEEWEYACRAGSAATYFFGASPRLATHYSWYVDNSNSFIWPVGMKKPNDLGLFDTVGNVLKWCHNSDERTITVVAPETVSGGFRVLRGGSYLNQPIYLRSAYRTGLQPGHRADNISFRVARTVS